jgi:divalent metal cation (Fe/Co/Zn/Cd) transporter
MPGNLTVEESHDLADHLESDLKLEYPRGNVTIHIEPCNEGCTRCGTFCTFYEKNKDSGESPS